MSRPRSSWDTRADPARSPLRGLTKLDPPIVITNEARRKAAKKLERATRPYRPFDLFQPSAETIRTDARLAMRRSALMGRPVRFEKRHSRYGIKVLCGELKSAAEHQRTEPDGTRTFMGELMDGRLWQVQVAPLI